MAIKKGMSLERHVVTKGNLPLLAAGVALFDLPTYKNGKPGPKFVNAAPGQLVAFAIDSTTGYPITVDTTNIDTIKGQLWIGVAVDTDGDGVADNVRVIGSENFDKCGIDEAKIISPVCSQPQILAAYLDCVKCWETYTAHFRWSDNITRSFGIARDDQEAITIAYSPECHSCDDCDPAVNADEVICALVDGINSEIDYSVGGLDYPDRVGFFPERPFRAVRLHENWYTYCLSPEAGDDCTSCNSIDSITGFSWGEGEGEEEFTLKGNLDPNDSTKTLIAQLKNVAWQIEDAFTKTIGPHAGFAFVTGDGYNKCCPLQLHVIACVDDFVLDGAEAPLVVCDDIDPYPVFTNKVKCVDCASPEATTHTPTRGLAVIIEQPSGNCDCDVSQPQAFYGRTGELFFLKDPNSSYPVIHATELLSPVFPRNFGSWIQWQEYQQDTGGRGRSYRDTNNNQGWLRTPDNVSRLKNAITHSDCKKDYCTYYMELHEDRPSLTKSKAFNKVSSFVHIPSTDSVTLVSWRAFFDKLLASSGTECKEITVGVCSTHPTPTPSVTPTASVTPSITPTVSVTPSITPSITPSASPA